MGDTKQQMENNARFDEVKLLKHDREILKDETRALKRKLTDVLIAIRVLAEENGLDGDNARGIIAMLADSVRFRDLEIGIEGRTTSEFSPVFSLPEDF